MGWVVYDTICKVFGQKKNGDMIVGIAVFIYVIVATYIACHLFSGRAAFLLTGAMLATAMSANVAHIIIPGQKKTIAAMKAGEKPDPIHPMRAKQRSVHNTYFTLPVLFAMLSNHYSMTYSAPNNWLVLVAIMLAGALIRQFFVLKHKGKIEYKYFAFGGAILVAVAAWIAPAPQSSASAEIPKFAEVRAIVEQRCVMCHNTQVISKNVQLHTPELIAKNAQAMYQQAVVSRLMPQNNATQITEAERAKLGAWFTNGAKVE
jgi:uncharacterized membrane protein